MARNWHTVECSPVQLEALRDGRLRALLLPERPYGVDEGLIFKVREQTSCAVISLVEKIEGDGSMLVHLGRVWSHSSGDEHEDVLAALEQACANVRKLSHPGQGTEPDRDNAARKLARYCELWSAIAPVKYRA